MNEVNNNEQDFFDVHYARQLGAAKENGDLILAYDGVLNTDTISKIENDVEAKITERGYPKALMKKIFFICVESLQNMLIHGHRDQNGAQHNFFILHQTEKAVKVTVANLINNTAIEGLRADISRINSFDDPAGLKEYYLEHLESNELSDKGGAGLGFITIGMKSGNKLTQSYEKINGAQSLFMLVVTISLA